MALNIITGVVYAPRGGIATTPVVVTGTGFGAVQGRVIFDPQNAAVDAVITVWQDDRIEFTVPALAISNQFTRVTIERQDLSDSETTPFWLPDVAITSLQALPAGLDYQFPAFEAGESESVDDPLSSGAADFCRHLDRTLESGALSVLGGANLGAGAAQVFAQITAQVMEFRSLASGADIAVSQSASEVAFANVSTLATVLARGASAGGAQIQADGGVDLGPSALTMGASIGSPDARLRRTAANTVTLDDGAGGVANLVIEGNLQVKGDTTTLDTINLTIEDQLILLSKGVPAGAQGGFAIERGATGDDAVVLWSETNSRFELGFHDTAAGTVAPASLGALADARVKDLSLAGANIAFDGAGTITSEGGLLLEDTLGGVSFRTNSITSWEVDISSRLVPIGSARDIGTSSLGIATLYVDTRITLEDGFITAEDAFVSNGILFAADDGAGGDDPGKDIVILAGSGNGAGNGGTLVLAPGSDAGAATDGEVRIRSANPTTNDVFIACSADDVLSISAELGGGGDGALVVATINTTDVVLDGGVFLHRVSGSILGVGTAVDNTFGGVVAGFFRSSNNASLGATGLNIASDNNINWNDNTDVDAGSNDLWLERASAGVLDINSTLGGGGDGSLAVSTINSQTGAAGVSGLDLTVIPGGSADNDPGADGASLILAGAPGADTPGGVGTQGGIGGSVFLRGGPAGAGFASPDKGNVVIGDQDTKEVQIAVSSALRFFGSGVAQLQVSDSVALTDSSGGSTDGTVAAVSGSGADSDINNNFAELTAKYNTLRDFARAHGLMA